MPQLNFEIVAVSVVGNEKINEKITVTLLCLIPYVLVDMIPYILNFCLGKIKYSKGIKLVV